MCGISGIVALHADGRVPSPAIERMIGVQQHRGPDARGTYLDPARRVVLGHNRLSIIDLSATGAQPMANPGERQVLCFNGEVYNFTELRNELGTERSFAGHSDTEVVLAAYERCVRTLRTQLDMAPLPETTQAYEQVRRELNIEY